MATSSPTSTAAEPSGYLESPTCSEALAAAEVVAALAGRPAPDLPEEVRADMTFVPVETLEQVVKVAFDEKSS